MKHICSTIIVTNCRFQSLKNFPFHSHLSNEMATSCLITFETNNNQGEEEDGSCHNFVTSLLLS